MQKWKPFCHLRKKLKPLLKNEAGVTLVELLAAIAILGIIIALAGSIHIFGQRQFRSQTESAKQANDLSHALSVMSTDLRRCKASEIEIAEIAENNAIKILNSEGEYVLTYYVDNSQLKHKGSVLIDGIRRFFAKKTDDGQGVHVEIQIASTAAGVEAKSYQTTIYFRVESPTTAASEE